MTAKTLLTVLAASAALSTAARAQDPIPAYRLEVKSMTVRTHDLNLDDVTGARKMLSRIAYAANQVCGQAGDIIDLDQRIKHRACVRETVEATLTKLDSPLVSQLYASPPQMTLARYNGN